VTVKVFEVREEMIFKGQPHCFKVGFSLTSYI
jgi:hypothetical protein